MRLLSKALIALVLVFAAASSAGAGIVNNSTSSFTAADSICLSFSLLDSMGSVTALDTANTDWFKIFVYNPSGDSVFSDSVDIQESDLVIEVYKVATQNAIFTYKREVEDFDGANVTQSGVWRWYALARDSSLKLTTSWTGEFQLYTTADINTKWDSTTMGATRSSPDTVRTAQATSDWNLPFSTSFTAGSMGDSANNASWEQEVNYWKEGIVPAVVVTGVPVVTLNARGSDADTGIVAMKTKLTTIALSASDALDTLKTYDSDARSWGANVLKYNGTAQTPAVTGFPDVRLIARGSDADTGIVALKTKLTTIAGYTDDIGVAGAGLTDLGGMSTTMKAQVQTEAEDAIVAKKLDKLIGITVTAATYSSGHSTTQIEVTGVTSAANFSNYFSGSVIVCLTGANAGVAKKISADTYGGSTGQHAFTTGPAWGVAPSDAETFLILGVADELMRGTNSAALASAYTATRAGYLDKLNMPGRIADSAQVANKADSLLLRSRPDSVIYRMMREVWRNQDSANVDTSRIGAWLMANIDRLNSSESLAVAVAIAGLNSGIIDSADFALTALNFIRNAPWQADTSNSTWDGLLNKFGYWNAKQQIGSGGGGGGSCSACGSGTPYDTIKVADSTGTYTLMPYAYIEVFDVATVTRQAWGFTGANGRIVFRLAASTAYLVNVFKPGYSFAQKTITTGSGANYADSVNGTEVAIGSPSIPNLCRLYGYVYTPYGNAANPAKVSVCPNQSGAARSGSLMIVPRCKTATTDTLGYFFLDVIKSDSLFYPSADSTYYYDITVTFPDEHQPGQWRTAPVRDRVLIPDSATHRIDLYIEDN